MIATSSLPALILLVFQLQHYHGVDGFLTGPPGRGRGNNGIVPPFASPSHHWGQPDDPDPSQNSLIASISHESITDEDNTALPEEELSSNKSKSFPMPNMTSSSDDIPRGGSSKSNNKVLKGAKSTLATTSTYWSSFIGNLGKGLTKPFRVVKEKVASTFESKEKKEEKKLLEKLETTKIEAVVLPKNTVVPKEVVQLAARRSGMIGNPLRTDRVQEFAAALKRWYHMRGYILHSVTGATLNTDSATAEIEVQEPHISSQPVDITFCKEMVVDEETGNLLTFRQYKERHTKRRTVGHKSITKEDTNTTFVQTTGKTRPNRIAKALALEPGQHFRWDPNRWNMVARSGIFGRVLQASPQRMRDGTVQLQILATEAPPRHLEYGVSKSLYTGSWEGEVDFQHENLLGGGETLGVMVRRGTKDPEPSVHIRFRDDKFGMPGGYDIEAFSDFIGDETKPSKADSKGDSETIKSARSETKDSAEGAASRSKSHDPNAMLDRRGVKFTYRNPIRPERIQYSTVSTALERTATQSGVREAIGSGTLAMGPFRRQLPWEARSSIDGSVTTGLRVPERTSPDHVDKADSEKGTSYHGLTLLPYTSCKLSTIQILPLFTSSELRRLPTFALRHSITASTRNLPRHEQNAIGFSSIIRGGSSHGRISTAITGSTELRFPLQLDIPVLAKAQQDASVVLFGDWVSVRKNNGSPFSVEKSIGVGVRKITQGIPLKVDFSYAGNGKIKSSFGLGRDFDV